MNRTVFLIPSTYGLIGWMIAIFFVAVDPVGMDPISGKTYFIIAYTLLMFVLTTVKFYPHFAAATPEKSIVLTRWDSTVFVGSTLIGIAALFTYYLKISEFYGGIFAFYEIVTSNALDIRANAEEFSSSTVQLTYFSWISIFVGAIMVSRKTYRPSTRAIILIVIVLEFLLNLTFIDRTRPVWIIVTSALGFLVARGLADARFRRNIVMLMVLPAIIFVAFSYMVGKFNNEFGIFGTMSAYIISGIGYMDQMVNTHFWEPDYAPIRTFLPISKALQSMGLLNDVPSNVLQDRYIPFPTNVGTIHEPYLSDGGLVYLIGFFPILLFFTNWVAVSGLRAHRVLGLLVWAHCVFSMLISFFVPKFNTTPFYFFIGVFMVFSVGYRKRRGTSVRPPETCRVPSSLPCRTTRARGVR